MSHGVREGAWWPLGTWRPLGTWQPIDTWWPSGWSVSRSVKEGTWWPLGTWRPLVPDDPLIRDDRPGEPCRTVLGKVPNKRWVPDDRQGGPCHTILRKVPDDHWVPVDPLVPDDPLIYMTTVRVNCVVRCQGRYLTTHWYVAILLVTEDSFGKLMMLLVIKDSRVLEKKFLTGENIPYQSCSTIDIFFF